MELCTGSQEPWAFRHLSEASEVSLVTWASIPYHRAWGWGWRTAEDTAPCGGAATSEVWSEALSSGAPRPPRASVRGDVLTHPWGQREFPVAAF